MIRDEKYSWASWWRERPGKRVHAEAVILHLNNNGMGIQFAAAGSVVYKDLESPEAPSLTPY